MQTPKQHSHKYLWAQGIFWSTYFLLNLVFASLYGLHSVFTLVIFLSLSILLAAMTHGLRWIYKHHAVRWSLLKVGFNLVWALPLLAIAAQFILFISVFMFYKIMPDNTANAQQASWGGFIGYSMNTCIMLILWSTFYLLRAEFIKRRDSEIAYWQVQAQLKENELQFLRSQINSHFLFNAINNLRAMVKEDAERTRTGLTDLSTLLRGLLQSDGQQLVTLRDELEWVRGYLALEALQFEDRLQFTFNVDESLLPIKLPPMILQTLVENAIKHGIAARRSGGLLQIDITRVNTQAWQIMVKNPPAEFQTTHQGNKIGIRNARERLQLAFGDNAHLDLIIAADMVTAKVEMPL